MSKMKLFQKICDKSFFLVVVTCLVFSAVKSRAQSSTLNRVNKKEKRNEKLKVDNPNVLFIMTDEQSYNMMSFTGNKYVSTPNIDRLAERGYSFYKTYVTNPVCTPSRFSLQTGHFSSIVGIKENYRSKKRYRYKQYDDYIQKSYAFDRSKVKKMKKQALGNVFRKAGYKTYYAGETNLYTGFSGWGYKLLTHNAYNGPAKAAEKMLPKIAKSKDLQPFLMFLSFKNPHDICYVGYLYNRAPKRLKYFVNIQKKMRRADYLKQLPPRPPSGLIEGENPMMVTFAGPYSDRGPRRWSHKGYPVWNAKKWDLYRWLYYRLVESVDKQIGRVLDALEKSGLKKNTIVIFTSDHGDMQGAHGLKGKNVLLKQAQRVPFIFAGSGIKKNVVNKTTLVSNGLDLLPTLCDLVGIQPPKGLPGISLEPYLTGIGKKPNRKYIISESFNAFQITDGKYKYTIYELRGHPEMLIDLKTDPEETVNVADDPAYQKIKASLKKKLMDNLSKRGLLPLPTDRAMKFLTPTRVVK